MKYNSEIHRRKSIRLKHFDYSQPGAYFITICTHNKECLFGRIENGEMILNPAGEIVEQCWMEIPSHFPSVQLDEFVIMPNHIHGILLITNENYIVGVQNLEPLQQNRYQNIIPRSIGSIIRGFKIGVTKWCRQNLGIYKIWQRNYYEHIIRSEDELNRIREYIINNPLQWQYDRENTVWVQNLEPLQNNPWKEIEETIYGKKQ